MDSSPRAACPLGPDETGPPPASLFSLLASPPVSPGERFDALGHGRIGKDR